MESSRSRSLEATERPRLSAKGTAATLLRRNGSLGPTGARFVRPPKILPPSTMAKSQFKAGGPTRGRLRVRKMGMGSGATVAKLKARGNVKGKKRG